MIFYILYLFHFLYIKNLEKRKKDIEFYDESINKLDVLVLETYLQSVQTTSLILVAK